MTLWEPAYNLSSHWAQILPICVTVVIACFTNQADTRTGRL